MQSIDRMQGVKGGEDLKYYVIAFLTSTASLQKLGVQPCTLDNPPPTVTRQRDSWPVDTFFIYLWFLLDTYYLNIRCLFRIYLLVDTFF